MTSSFIDMLSSTLFPLSLPSHMYREASLYRLNSTSVGSLSEVKRRFHDAPLYKRYPEQLHSIYFEYEKNWDYGVQSVLQANELWRIGLPFQIVAVYLLVIYSIQHLMKDRKPFQVKTSWCIWNLFLSIFSFCGMMRMLPFLIEEVFFGKGVYHSVCSDAWRYGNGPEGLWTFLFIYSKIPELVDTLFIVLGKRKLIFLHWYHHCTVLLFCWHAYAYASSAGLWFIAMNYSVHAVMYFYYFLKGLGFRLSWLAPVVTSMQILQMVAGIFVNVCVYLFMHNGLPCGVYPVNWYACLGMYFSYFLLFASFALKRYCTTKKQKVKTI